MRRTISLWMSVVGWVAIAATASLAQDTGNTRTHQVQPGEHLLSLSLYYNICIPDIKAANPGLEFGEEYAPLPRAEIEIPTNAPECYEIYMTEEGETPLEVSEKFNICPEVLALLNTFNTGNPWYPRNVTQPLEAGTKFHLPKDEPPCYNDAGQRLYYQSAVVDGDWQYIGEYTDMQVYTSLDFADNLMGIGEQLSICPADLIWLNAAQVFIKHNARACDFVVFNTLDLTLYDVSREYNVCLETLIDVNNWWWHETWEVAPDSKLGIPQELSPCYDDDGNRVNHDDKTVHETQPNEFLIDIAEQYDVCIQDLVAANPFIHTHRVRPPQILFIPDVPLCDNPREYTLRDGETYVSVSQYYNVCLNRIVDANPQLMMQQTDASETPFYILDLALRQPEAGITLTVPERPACYEMIYQEGNYIGTTMPEYVCYAQPIDVSEDYTGHEPVISPIAQDAKDNFCYAAGEYATTLIYENEPVTLYRIRPYDTMFTVAQCFHVDITELVNLNTPSAYPSHVHQYGSWVLPPHYDRNCELLALTPEQYNQQIRDLMNRAGSLGDDGIYIVNHQDTLSSIGKQFGYLPQWIAAANNLENPEMIFYLQELKMPSYPNYWQLAGIGGGIIAVLAIGTGTSLLRRWRRRKPKRKNEDVS